MIPMKASVACDAGPPDWKCNVLYWMLFDFDQHLYYKMVSSITMASCTYNCRVVCRVMQRHGTIINAACMIS